VHLRKRRSKSRPGHFELDNKGRAFVVQIAARFTYAHRFNINSCCCSNFDSAGIFSRDNEGSDRARLRMLVFAWIRFEKARIIEVITAPRSPRQNAYVERVLGSIRRECLDHIVTFNERHLRRVLSSYADYYQRTRTHL
jgi:hypothetical protein